MRELVTAFVLWSAGTCHRFGTFGRQPLAFFASGLRSKCGALDKRHDALKRNMMFEHEMLPDAVSGDAPVPWDGYGPLLKLSDEVVDRFYERAAIARQAISEGFGVDLSDCNAIPEILERIVTQAWDEGWNSQQADLSLFVSEFGLVLTDAMHRRLGAQLVFRSSTDYMHLSCWWEAQNVEAFPFHKVYKRLTHYEGDSLEFYVHGIRRWLTND